MKTLPRLLAVVGLSVLALSGVPRVSAIDPLPPELEKAPLEKQVEWWQRYSRDGGELRHKVAMQRWAEGQARKKELLTAMSEHYERARAETEGKAPPQGAESGQADDTAPASEPSPWASGLTYAMIFGGLALGFVALHRTLRETEQTS
jgi:hypothetical protein